MDILYLIDYTFGDPQGPEPQCSGTVPGEEYIANVFIDAEVTSEGDNPDVVEKGDNFTIDIYMQNSSGFKVYGYSCTWKIYSPTGNNVTYVDMGGETYDVPSMILPFGGWRLSSTPGEFYWSLLNSYTMFNMDGILPDTFSHVAIDIPNLPNSGIWPETDNLRELRFQIGMNCAEAGIICIDSIDYSPNSNYDWLWAPHSDPEWLGEALCVNIVDSLLCGDTNSDGNVNLLDILIIIGYLYADPPGYPPVPWDAGDVNNDGKINLLDILYLISYLYVSPPGPDPHCI